MTATKTIKTLGGNPFVWMDKGADGMIMTASINNLEAAQSHHGDEAGTADEEGGDMSKEAAKGVGEVHSALPLKAAHPSKDQCGGLK